MGRKEHEKELQTGKEGVADRGKEKDADSESYGGRGCYARPRPPARVGSP